MATLKQKVDQILTGEPKRFIGVVGKEAIRVERVWQHIAEKLEIYANGKWQVPVKKIKLTQAGINDIKKFVNEGAELSLFSTKQVFIIQQLEKAKANQIDELLKIMDLNNDNYYFFLGESLLKTSRLRKAIDKSGAFIEITALKPADLNRWITTEFKIRKLKAAESVNQYLMQAGDESVDEIVKMIDLLELYSNSEEVTLSDCQELFVRSDVADEFAWINAISSGNKAKATSLILSKLRSGEVPFPMLGTIFKNYLSFYLISKLRERGQSQNQILKELAMNPFAFKHQYPATLGKNSTDLHADLKKIISTDAKFKNKSLGYDELLTSLVENLN